MKSCARPTYESNKKAEDAARWLRANRGWKSAKVVQCEQCNQFHVEAFRKPLT